MIILGLDPSYKAVGYAVLLTDPEEQVMDWGVWKYPGAGANRNVKLSWYHHQLDHQLREWSHPSRHLTPGIVAIELPVLSRGAKNVKTVRHLAELGGALRLAILYRTSARILGVIPSQRRAAMGIPTKLKGKDAKAAIIGPINARFGLELQLKDHDAADAIAVALAAETILRREALLE